MYKAVRRGTTEVAVKLLNPRLDSISLRALHKEIVILQTVSHHRSIVQFYGANLSEPGILCMEYMKVGIFRLLLFFRGFAGVSPTMKA